MNRGVWAVVRALLAVALLGAGLLAAAGPVGAVELVEGSTIPAGQTIDDDAFIGGDNVLVEGTVNGDLFVAGGNIRINGTVGGSLVVAGQTIAVNGQVQGSVYAGGTSVTLGGGSSVGRNVYYAGYGFEAQPGSMVERDLVVAGYQALLSGDVGRDVLAGTAALVLSGSVGRDVRADVGAPDGPGFTFFAPPGAPASVPPGIRVTPGAEIGGRIVYTSPEQQQGAIEAEPEAGIEYRTPVPERQARPDRDARGVGFLVLQWIIARLRDLVTLLLLGALILWLWPRWLHRAADALAREPLASLGWGLIVWLLGFVVAGIAAFLIVIVAILLGIITLGGLAFAVLGLGFSLLGLAFTLFWLSVTYISKIVVAFVVGRWIVRALSRREEREAPAAEPLIPPDEETGAVPPERRMETTTRPGTVAEDGGALVIGVLVYVLLRAIPIVGWLIGAVVTLFGLGAMLLAYRGWRRERMTSGV